MARKKPFNRKSRGSRETKTTVLIAVEGVVTECDYFNCLKNLINEDKLNIQVFSGKNHQSDPTKVLKKMQAKQKNMMLEVKDEAWIVIDRDNHADKSLETLVQWKSKDERHYIAISNPKFELWLLWHFEESCKLPNLLKYLQNKNVPCETITLDKIDQAIQRAKIFEDLAEKTIDAWPPRNTSAVYKLVNSIFSKQRVK